MFLVLLSFVMIVGSNWYLSTYGYVHVLGLVFPIAAVLFTPFVVIRDTLHERGQYLYATISIILGVIGTYYTVDAKYALAAGLALFWAFLLDTNIFAAMRMRYSVWPSRIVSDFLTVPTIPFFFFWIKDHTIYDVTKDQGMLIRYLTLIVLYGIMYLHDKTNNKDIEVDW